MRRTILLLSALLLFSETRAQTPGQTITDRWHGYARERFRFEGREAWIVKPATALPGKPWIWKAYFPDWHTDIDSILLSRGFHLAYLETNDMFGSPAAMQVWNRFHARMTKNGFAEKAALEGISRGGLYVYNWAKRNPLKVSCIYAEAPVCDIRSWPGGKGKSAGSPKDWKLLLDHYGMTEAQAADFRDNPLDGLEGLAAAGVPVLHSIGLQDRIVPNEENSFLLADRYVRLGGTATLMPMTRGVQGLEGHHFPIDRPGRIADFIFSNSVPVTKLIPPEAFHVSRSGLQNSLNRFTVQKTGRVAFMGGSITEGKGWRDLVCKYLSERFPQTRFEFINAGISSTGSTPGSFRLQQDVLQKGPIDLFFEEAAVNDDTNGFSDRAQVRGMEGIIRRMRMEHPSADIIMMHCVDPGKMETYRTSKVPAVIVNHEKVAAHYQVNTVHLAKEVTARIDAGEFTWKEDFRDLHPSPFGHQVYARTIIAYLDRAFEEAAEKPIRPHVLPAMIDTFSYAKGSYLPVSAASVIKGWRIDPNWVPKDSVATRKQYVNIPALVAETPGALMELRFTGTAIGICIASGPDAGHVRYSIDGGPARTMELRTKWSGMLHLPWYVMLEDELPRSAHTLRIELSDEKHPDSKGTACRILHFLLNE
jgi:lysophospholipase L1-like esterase